MSGNKIIEKIPLHKQTCPNDYIIDILYTSYWCVDTCAWPWSFFAICDIACCADMHFFINRVHKSVLLIVYDCVCLLSKKRSFQDGPTHNKNMSTKQ